MKKYKAIIIDDEPKLQKVLQSKVNKHCPEIEVVALASSASEGYESIILNSPDLIFLDISMSGESGFDLLNYFESFSFEIIFVTGYSEYAIEALRLSAVDYLLKPTRNKLLIHAVQKAIHRIEDRKNIERYKVLKNNINVLDKSSTKISLPGIKKYSFIEVNDIIRCEGASNYTKIHLRGGEILVSSYTLGVIRELLVNFSFYSIHKSHFINVSQIKSYLRSGIVILRDETKLPVSRRNRKAFLEQCVEKNKITQGN